MIHHLIVNSNKKVLNGFMREEAPTAVYKEM